jgi:hypothetical protein
VLKRLRKTFIFVITISERPVLHVRCQRKIAYREKFTLVTVVLSGKVVYCEHIMFCFLILFQSLLRVMFLSRYQECHIFALNTENDGIR